MRPLMAWVSGWVWYVLSRLRSKPLPLVRTFTARASTFSLGTRMKKTCFRISLGSNVWVAMV